MNKSILIIILTLLLSLQVYGQGLNGNRITLTYHFCPALSFNYGEGINAMHLAEVNFVAHKNLMLGVNAVRMPSIGFFYSDIFGETRDTETSVYGYGFQAKIYNSRRGAIAPLGSYTSFKLNRYLTTSDELFSTNEVIKSYHITAHMEVGRTSVILPRLLFNYSCETGILFFEGRLEGPEWATRRASIISNPLQGNLHLCIKFGLVYLLI